VTLNSSSQRRGNLSRSRNGRKNVVEIARFERSSGNTKNDGAILKKDEAVQHSRAFSRMQIPVTFLKRNGPRSEVVLIDIASQDRIEITMNPTAASNQKRDF
jgi:hypothetical protein